MKKKKDIKKICPGRCEMLPLWYGRMLVALKVQMTKKGTVSQSKAFVQLLNIGNLAVVRCRQYKAS